MPSRANTLTHDGYTLVGKHHHTMINSQYDKKYRGESNKLKNISFKYFCEMFFVISLDWDNNIHGEPIATRVTPLTSNSPTHGGYGLDNKVHNIANNSQREMYISFMHGNLIQTT